MFHLAVNNVYQIQWNNLYSRKSARLNSFFLEEKDWFVFIENIIFLWLCTASYVVRFFSFRNLT